jgi:hypothetical protein
MSQASETQGGCSPVDRLTAFFDPASQACQNREKRFERFCEVDQLMDQVPSKEWRRYLDLREGSEPQRTQALEIENRYGVIRFLNARLKQAFAHVRRRNVTESHVAVTYLYNMGFIVETPEVAIGIDLAGPFVEELADTLDALTISHPHPDHISAPLLRALHRRGKPVYAARCGWWDQTPYRDQITGLAQGECVGVGPVKITAHIGDHYPASYTRFNANRVAVSTGNMLDVLIETDPRAPEKSVLVYHVGDDFNKQSMLSGPGGRRVDVFLGRGCPAPDRWQSPQNRDAGRWRDLNESIGDPAGVVKALNPGLFLPGHMAEMNHEKNIGGCMPFRDAFGVASVLPPSQAEVLIWGERILLFKKPDGKLLWRLSPE